METVDEKYKEGFNTGYWLARGSETAEKGILNDWIKRQNPELPYAKGLLAGKKQMEKEKLLSQMKEKTNTKDKDQEH